MFCEKPHVFTQQFHTARIVKQLIQFYNTRIPATPGLVTATS